jgi:hypothetical protein
LAALFVWSFGVLSAAQLTIRLIMAFDVRLTLVAALVLSAAAIVVAFIDDAIVGGGVGGQATLARRIEFAPVSMLLMAIAGFAIARWVLHIKRLRGQIIAGLMVGLLDAHLFTLITLS